MSQNQKRITSFFSVSCTDGENPGPSKKRNVSSQDDLNASILGTCTNKAEKNDKPTTDVRHYNRSWEKTFNWLYEDKVRGGAFCKLCEMYVNDNQSLLQRSSGVFSNQPFTNYKNALGKDGKLMKHATSKPHIKSVALNSLRIIAEANPVHNQILIASEQERDTNRKCLSLLITGIYFLVKEEIAHTTKYQPLVERLLRKSNNSLDTWVSSQCERSTYVSKATASELVCCIGEVLDNYFTKHMQNRKFSLMADESTNIKNESELSICIRYVENTSSVEVFVCVVKVDYTKAQTIADAIDKVLVKRQLRYDNLVACAFDGAANMSGNKNGVRRLLSKKANREIPYVHCRAHILNLALTSMRNKFPKIKRVLHVVKDIYKLFHQSPKRESVLHNIQTILNDPILKIPEAIDIRWLSHFKTVHAIKRSYIAIMMACEHIHKDGADLASLAGGILLELQNKSFLLTLCGLDEALGAVANLSLTLQKSDLQAATLPMLINATTSHLKNISDSCTNVQAEENVVLESVNEIIIKAETYRVIIDDDPALTSLKTVKAFVDGMVYEMDRRFNDTAIKIIEGCAIFSNFNAFLKASNKDFQNLSSCFEGIGLDESGVLADVKSFRFLAQNLNMESSPTQKLLEINIGYENLRALAELVMCVPVTTAGVERSFSTMNRILNKLRNRMGEETLEHCIKISIEGPECISDEFIGDVINRYAQKKQRRIRLI